MSRRAEIRMSSQERTDFLASQRVVTCASIGPNGRPHLMPLWYVPEEGRLLCWTYAASQKTKNLERLPQATLQIEAGVSYDELRGVMMECDVELIRDPERVQAAGLAIALRYAPFELAPGQDPPPELVEFVSRQAAKRVALQFVPTRTVTWDHRKLAGAY